MSKTAYLRFLVIVPIALMPLMAAAQTSEEESPPQAATEEEKPTFTGEIIVEAQKRPEPLVDVPISITSTASDELEKLAVFGLFDLENLVPGMRVDHYGAYSQPTIRGVGTQDVTGPGANANVAMYVDGFYLPSQAGNIFEFTNIERVDVLKGPQGTLFGQNATGGAILVTTPDPSFTPSGYVRAGYASFNDFRASIYGTTGLSDTWALDWSFYYRDSDNYFDDVYLDKPTAPIENIVGRTKLMYKPSDTTKVILTLGYTDLNNPTGLAEVTRQPIAQFYHDAYGVPIVTTLEPYKTSLNHQVKANPVAKVVQLTADFDLGGVTMTSLTQYRDQDTDVSADLDGTTIQYWNVDYTETEETFTQEFNFGGKSERLDWTAGAFYLWDRGALTNNAWQDIFNLGVQTNWLYSDVEVTTQSFAAYADGVIGLGDAFFLTLGGRFTSEKKSLESQGLLDPFIPYSDSTTWNEFTPRAALRYAVSDNSNVYASFSQGFMSGNYTYTTVGPQEPVDPEKMTQYELGYKIADPAWAFDTAVFYSDYTDLQVFEIDQTTGFVVLTNAPKAEIYGWEGQLGWQTTKNLFLNLGAAYTKSEYKEFTGIGLTVLPADLRLRHRPDRFQRPADAPHSRVDGQSRGYLHRSGELRRAELLRELLLHERHPAFAGRRARPTILRFVDPARGLDGQEQRIHGRGVRQQRARRGVSDLLGGGLPRQQPHLRTAGELWGAARVPLLI